MASQYIIQGIFALAGIVSLLAALLDWDWFSQHATPSSLCATWDAGKPACSTVFWDLSL